MACIVTALEYGDVVGIALLDDYKGLVGRFLYAGSAVGYSSQVPRREG